MSYTISMSLMLAGILVLDTTHAASTSKHLFLSSHKWIQPSTLRKIKQFRFEWVTKPDTTITCIAFTKKHEEILKYELSTELLKNFGNILSLNSSIFEPVYTSQIIGALQTDETCQFDDQQIRKLPEEFLMFLKEYRVKLLQERKKESTEEKKGPAPTTYCFVPQMNKENKCELVISIPGYTASYILSNERLSQLVRTVDIGIPSDIKALTQAIQQEMHRKLTTRNSGNISEKIISTALTKLVAYIRIYMPRDVRKSIFEEQKSV